MWNELHDQSQIDNFMNYIWGFHDTVIKEMKYVSGAYLNENNGMHVVNDKRVLAIIFQGNLRVFSAIEVEFIGIKYLNLVPVEEAHTCEILGATMLIKDNYIYWCDDDYLTEADIEEYLGTLICASAVRWRPVDEYVGSDEIYKAAK